VKITKGKLPQRIVVFKPSRAKCRRGFAHKNYQWQTAGAYPRATIAKGKLPLAIVAFKPLAALCQWHLEKKNRWWQFAGAICSTTNAC